MRVLLVSFLIPQLQDSIDEKKRIQALHGFITEDRRVNGVLALSRALGDTEQQPHVTYRPDVLEMDVSDAIEHLVLACDGLWDVLSNDQVVDYVKVRSFVFFLCLC
jgi:serine/threonine protein phosphatase PrpC